MNKHDLRKRILNIRRGIKDKEEKSHAIIKNIEGLNIYQRAKVIAMYNSLKDEVDLKELIINAQNSGKIVLLPRVLNNDLIFIKIDNNTVYEKSTFGVLEPVINNNIWCDTIDLIIVPGVSFDKEKNRIGYGKGYYDRFLKSKDIFKIGVCFSLQVVSKLPHDLEDIPVNMIITEEKSFN